MDLNIVYLPGDGIGPEVGDVAVRCLEKVCERFGHGLNIDKHAFGGASIDLYGVPLTGEILEACKASDAVLLGAIGGPKWAHGDIRPEQGLLKLRQELQTFANVRPVKTHEIASQQAPLKAEILKDVDIVVIRELTGGIYFGEKGKEQDKAYDICSYSRGEVERIIRFAADLAMTRNKKLTSVDKANVLETSRFWREITTQIVKDEYPELILEHLYIDAATMHLLDRPSSFDVIVTENMFGDILTDEASMLAGSLGLLPSASLGEARAAIYEPIHGSAPDIAGQNKANPVGMVLSVVMMLRYSFNLEKEANYLENKVKDLLDLKVFTADLKGSETTLSLSEKLFHHL